jgi:hypothetical protein
MIARMLTALLLVAACTKEPQTKMDPSGPGPTPGSGAVVEPGSGATGGSGSTAQPGTTPTPTAPGGPKLGEPCGNADSCGEGACVTYYGIAGPRGPAFKSCEVKCDPQRPCEGGRRCVTVADGPGQVCR